MLGYGGFDPYGFYPQWADLPFEAPGLDPLMLEAPKVESNPPPYSPSFYGSQFINDEELKQHPSADDDGYTADASAISSSASISTENDSPRLFSSPIADESDDSSMSLSPPLAPTTAAWDYESLLRNTEYNPNLTTILYEIFDTILDGREPSKERVKQFLDVNRGRFYCAVQNCKWHSIGWKREDRGVTHFKKEHLRLLKYPCSDCDQVYKWPHDLTAHRRRQHLKLPQELYVCTEW
ncbi:hypothetical protein FRC17_006588 [Serendipita sp. 399]|nr:hypothetical protein FRC17_006588 [Serendipita sp. 399]